MSKEYDEDGVKPVTPLPKNKKDAEGIDYSDVNTEKGSLDRIGSLLADHYTDLQRKESIEVESVTSPPPPKNQKDAVGEVQEITIEYSNLFKERRSALKSALTTKLPSEIELERKSNKELDEGDVEPVTPPSKSQSGGIDYSQGTTAREELLTGTGISLADNYTDLKRKNNNLVKLFDLLKEKKLTFTDISKDSARYPEESDLIKKIFKTSFTIEQAKQADEIIQQKVFTIPKLKKNLNDLLKVQKKKKVSFEEPEMQKKKEKPDFESHEKKRISGAIDPIQREEKIEQRPLRIRIREFLRSIPIIGRFLANIFTPEKIEIISNPIYTSQGVGDKESQQDKTIVHSDKAKDDITITKKDNKDVREVSSEVKEGSITKVDSEKDRELGGPGG